MPLFAVALLARNSDGIFERLESIPVLVAANSEREAGKEAKREARRAYPKSEGWRITGRVIEIDQAKLLHMIFTVDDETALLSLSESLERIH